MGVCYILADDGNRRYFDLDKGPWWPLMGAPNTTSFGAERRAVDYEAIAAWRGRLDALIEEIVGDDRGDIAYWTAVVVRIYAFCEEAGWRKLRVLDDSRDEYHCLCRTAADGYGTIYLLDYVNCLVHETIDAPPKFYAEAGSRFGITPLAAEAALAKIGGRG